VGYWRYLSESYIQSLELKPDQKTKTIHFPPDQTIKTGDDRFIDQWIEVIKSNRRGPHFEELQELREKANPALKESRPEFAKIHQFLDEYNHILDFKYPIVKERLYPDTWKVGYASAEYEEDGIIFSLYPIPNNTNDIQIKEVEANDFRAIIDEIETATSAHSISQNPIEKNPTKYANDLIYKNVLEIVGRKALDHSNNEFIAKELVFYLIDEYHELMGLDRVDEISIDRFKESYEYLQYLIDEYIYSEQGRDVGQLANEGYINLAYLRENTNQNWDSLRDSVEERIVKDGDIGQRYAIGDITFRPWQLSDALDALEKSDDARITRPYAPPNFSLVDGDTWGQWQAFSPDSIEDNLRTVHNNLNREFNKIVKTNFPDLHDVLRLYPESNRLIVELTIPEEDNKTAGMPSQHIKKLRAESSQEFEVDIYRSNDPEIPDIEFGEREIELDGREYRLWGTESGIANYILHPMPLTSEIYDRLEDMLKSHFKERVEFAIIV